MRVRIARKLRWAIRLCCSYGDLNDQLSTGRAVHRFVWRLGAIRTGAEHRCIGHSAASMPEIHSVPCLLRSLLLPALYIFAIKAMLASRTAEQPHRGNPSQNWNRLCSLVDLDFSVAGDVNPLTYLGLKKGSCALFTPGSHPDTNDSGIVLPAFLYMFA